MIRKRIKGIKTGLKVRKEMITAITRELISLNQDIEKRINELKEDEIKNKDLIDKWQEISNTIDKFHGSKVLKIRHVLKIKKRIRDLRNQYPEE